MLIPNELASVGKQELKLPPREEEGKQQRLYALPVKTHAKWLPTFLPLHDTGKSCRDPTPTKPTQDGCNVVLRYSVDEESRHMRARHCHTLCWRLSHLGAVFFLHYPSALIQIHGQLHTAKPVTLQPAPRASAVALDNDEQKPAKGIQFPYDPCQRVMLHASVVAPRSETSIDPCADPALARRTAHSTKPNHARTSRYRSITA